MYVRLAFAVAAHLEPEILIVDEVLAVGDAEFQKKCLGKMSQVATGGRTVLFVSHNMGAVGDLCRRCILLSHGSIVKDGSSFEAIAKYMSARPSAGKLGHPAGSGRDTAVISAELVGKGVSGNCVFWSNNFELQIYYQAAQIPQLEVAFSVFDQGRRKVFYSSSRHPCADGMPCGVYLAKARIPARFLAPGIYSVTVGLEHPNVSVHDLVSDLIVFTVISDNPEHYRYHGADVGAVTVDIDWMVERCEPPHDGKLGE